MNVRYELQIATRYLRARRRDAFISITTIFTALGVMLGVAALVVVLAVMSGFEASLRRSILTLTPQVQITSYAGSISDYAGLARRAAALPAITSASPFMVGEAMMSSQHGLSGVLLRGIEAKDGAVASQLHQYLQSGSIAGLTDRAAGGSSAGADGVVAIGTTLAAKLKIRAGEPVNVVVPIVNGGSGELGTKIGHFTVGAIFGSGVAFIDRDLVFMGLGNAQRFLGRPDKADGLELRLKSLDHTREVTTRLRTLLGPQYRVTNWMEFDQSAAAGFELLKRVYALVLLILIAVAAFNLVATLIMVVMEKRKDIAVLMAMGATPKGIRLIFVLKGLIVGAAGTVAGLGMGGIACFLLAHYHFIHIQKEIYGIATLPVAPRPLSFVLVGAASMLLCLIATFYPARQAARALPVEIFRS